MTSEAGKPRTLPPPRADQLLARPPADPLECPRRPLWVPVTGLVAAVAGVVGALLPAFDGQRVGDPASTAYRIGVPLGLLGAGLALLVGIWSLARGGESLLHRGVAIAAVALGSIALLLTVALLFSG